jgi:hypothetical protein
MRIAAVAMGGVMAAENRSERAKELPSSQFFLAMLYGIPT